MKNIECTDYQTSVPVISDFESHITNLTQDVNAVDVMAWNLSWRGSDIGDPDKREMLRVAKNFLGRIQGQIQGDCALLVDITAGWADEPRAEEIKQMNDKKIEALKLLFTDSKRAMEMLYHIERLLDDTANDGGNPVPTAEPASYDG